MRYHMYRTCASVLVAQDTHRALAQTRNSEIMRISCAHQMSLL